MGGNDHFRIYKASAGSGKTYTLVLEYLDTVLKKPQAYRNVLAITFTNKAAGEMKERILEALSELSKGSNPTLASQLQERTKLSDEAIKANAGQTLSLILHDYANFGVSTIDSFTYRLVRNFAKDLDLPSRFDIELDSNGLLDRMTDQLMDSIGRDDYVTRVLEHFAAEKLKNNNNWKIEADLKNTARELFREESLEHLKNLQDLEGEGFLELIDFIKNQKETYPEQISDLAGRAVKMIREAHLGADDFRGGSRGAGPVFFKLCKPIKPGEYKKLIERSAFVKSVEEGNWAKNKSTVADQVDKLAQSGLQVLAEQITAYHKENYDQFVTAYYAYENIHSLAVIRQIEDLLEEYKEVNNLVPISDLQRKISGFIQNEPPDYIYWRLGEKFRHYLVDEFQDTSVMQWLNLYPLFDYLQSEPDRPGSLLLVGDSKQAIYRWRGGNISLMEEIAPHMLETEPLALRRNWRSGEYIVKFNNRFFGKVREIFHDNSLVSGIYQDFEQEHPPNKDGEGFVQMDFLDIPGNQKTKFREASLEKSLHTLQDLFTEGYQPGQIAFLVRTGREGSEAAKYLTDNGIRVISSDSLLISKEPVVNFIISLLKFLVDRFDRIGQTEVLHYYELYLRNREDRAAAQEEIRLMLGEKDSFRQLTDRLPEEFRKLQYKTDQMPLYEMVEEIIRIFGLPGRSDAYLQRLLDAVLEFSGRRRPDVAAFLDHWEEKKDSFSLVVPEGENAVEIMTLHKSKGLQFPVVIIPFADWSVSPKTGNVFWAEQESAEMGRDTFLVPWQNDLKGSNFEPAWREEMEKSALDNINLLYVAFTRPEDRLYIFAPKMKQFKGLPKSEDIRNVGDLCSAVLTYKDFEYPEEGKYESGFPFGPSKPFKQGSSLHAGLLASTGWRKRIRILKKFRKFWDKEQTGSGQQISDATILAEILRRLDDHSQSERVLQDLLEEGMFTEDRQGKLQLKLAHILSQKEIKAVFAPGLKIKRGVNLIDPKGENLRPDRVILEGETTRVLFFELPGAKQSLKDQLLKTEKVLLQMGSKKVIKSILKIENAKLTEVKV